MTSAAMTNAVRQRARQAGLQPLSPQDLRRTAIHDLIAAGVSLAEVHQRFGFVSLLTRVARYHHRDLTDERWRTWLNLELPVLKIDSWSSRASSGTAGLHPASADERLG